METGITYTVCHTVDEKDLAANMGSGDLRVLATPAMMAWMEEAAMQAVASQLPGESTTVGGFISASHIKPTAPGGHVTATAVLTKAEGKKLTFEVLASDEDGCIGKGEHIRFIVEREKFMARL